MTEVADTEGGGDAGAAPIHDPDRGATGWNAASTHRRALRNAGGLHEGGPTRDQARKEAAWSPPCAAAGAKPMDAEFQRGETETACGARNLNSLSRFPSGKSRGGRVPPTPKARCAPAESAGSHRCCRLPPQEGLRPLVHPPFAPGNYRKPTAYAEPDFRNFLLCGK